MAERRSVSATWLHSSFNSSMIVAEVDLKLHKSLPLLRVTLLRRSNGVLVLQGVSLVWHMLLCGNLKCRAVNENQILVTVNWKSTFVMNEGWNNMERS